MRIVRVFALPVAMRAALLGTFLLSLVCLQSAPASAALRQVNNQVVCSDTTGTPYCTINAAVAAAVGNDTVSVAPGNYSGKVTVTHSGTSGVPFAISADPGVTLTSTTQGFDLSGVSWVTINGFTVDNTTNESFRCTLCSNVTLSNNRVTNSRSSGFFINNSNNTVLFNNQVEDSLGIGIDIAGSTAISVLGGYVTRSGLPSSGNTRNGIRFSTSSASLVDGTQVYENTDNGVFVINGSNGIRIKRVIAHHNARVYNTNAAGIEFQSSGNIVESCITYQNEDSGINMRFGGADGLMVNNVIYLNGDHGIDVLESPRPVIVNNTVYQNTTSGINVEGNSGNGFVYNNISVDNALVDIGRKRGNINIGSSSPTLAADYNLVSACCGSPLYVYLGTTYSTVAGLPGAVELNGIQALPGWLDTANNDFHLTAGSPAIDSAKFDAIATSERDHDVEGNARCDNPSAANTGTGPISYMDRGPYEFAASCAGPDTSPPSVPQNLAGTAVSPTQINLTWNASTDNTAVTGYKVFRDSVEIATVTAPATSYSNTGLTANTPYSYTVVAFDAVPNTSAQSSPVSVTTQAASDSEAPTVPANLAATAFSMTQINLTWNASTDNVAVTGYKVFRGGVEIATVTAPATSYSNTGLTPNTTYSYTVAAFDAVPNTSLQSSPDSAATLPDTAAPSVPGGLAGTAVSPTQINLTWNASSDNVAVTGYKVFRSGVEIATVTAPATSHSDTGLTANTPYSYTVAAFDAVPNTSAQSAPVSLTTPPVSTTVTWEGRVSVGSNDAEESSNGSVKFNNSDLELVLDATLQTVGIRFVNVAVPNNAVISNAYIQFQVDEVSTAAASLTIKGVAADSTPTFTTAASNVSSRPRTTAFVPWVPASWPTIDVATAAQRTPNLSPVIQEIVNRVGWASNNALAIIVTGTGKRVAEAFEGVPAAAPLLHIEWTAGAPDTSPPSVPQNLAGTAVSPTQINLTWNASTDNTAVTGYKVFRDSVEIATVTAPATSYSNTGLTANTPYSYTVVAFDAVPNTSAQSSPVSVTTQAASDSEAPTVPANLAATAFSMTQINLTWNASTDNVAVTGYKVFRGGVEIATVTAPATSYSNTGLTPNTTYSYTVAAFDAVPNTSLQSSPDSAATLPDTAAPSVPGGLAGTAVSPTQINLTWNASSDNVAVTGYKVFRSGVEIATVTAPATSHSDTGLTANTPYSYTVAAFDAVPNTSAQSAPVSLTTPPVSTTVTWEGRVSASGNDAEEFIGGTTTDLSSTDLELVTDGTTLQLVGMRFVNLTIPQNATITNAYIQFTTDEVSPAAASLSIAAEAVDNSAIFTTADNNISARVKTSVTASWSPPAWNTIDEAGASQRTSNLASVVQQIVSRGGWAGGNALSFIVGGSGKRVASSFNISSGAKAPLLHVEYSSP